jgi:electron transfer flavoprotein beta subunit
MDRGVLVQTDGSEWDPQAAAAEIVEAIRAQDAPFDLLLFGNESADTGNFQVPIRVARALGLPCVVGAKALEVRDGTARVRREAAGGWEEFELPLPAVLSVKEGINLPRYPSIPGRLKAKQKPVERREPSARPRQLRLRRLEVPHGRDQLVEVLGEGPDAAPKVVEILRSIGAV